MEFYATDDACEDYKDLVPYPPEVPQTIIQYLKQVKKTDDHQFDLFVDAGCGGGMSTHIFAPYFRSIIGFDPSPGMLKIAKASKVPGNIEYMEGSGENMPVKSGTADLITSAYSVQYMDLKKFIRECKRVLKDDGCVALYGYDYFDVQLRNGDDVIKKEDDETKRLLNSYVDSITNHFEATNNSELRSMNRFQTMFSEIEEMRKERVDNVKFEVDMSLEQYKSQFLGIPTYKTYEDLTEANNVAELIRNLKNHWRVSDLENTKINIRSIYSLFFIFLTK